jgi:hypothetical protein
MRPMQQMMGMGGPPAPPPGPPLDHSGPGSSEEEPPSKKQKTEDNLIPEEIFLSKNKVTLSSYMTRSKACYVQFFLQKIK